jgi:hypothetical protein
MRYTKRRDKGLSFYINSYISASPNRGSTKPNLKELLPSVRCPKQDPPPEDPMNST